MTAAKSAHSRSSRCRGRASGPAPWPGQEPRRGRASAPRHGHHGGERRHGDGNGNAPPAPGTAPCHGRAANPRHGHGCALSRPRLVTATAEARARITITAMEPSQPPALSAESSPPSRWRPRGRALAATAPIPVAAAVRRAPSPVAAGALEASPPRTASTETAPRRARRASHFAAPQQA